MGLLDKKKAKPRRKTAATSIIPPNTQPTKIVAVAHDNKKRITHVQLESSRVYTFDEIAGFIKNKQYLFVTQAPDKVNYASVSVRAGKKGKFLTTLKNKTKDDNLDYMPPLVP